MRVLILVERRVFVLVFSLKTIRGGDRVVEGDCYIGEEGGIRANLKKSRNLSS